MSLPPVDKKKCLSAANSNYPNQLAVCLVIPSTHRDPSSLPSGIYSTPDDYLTHLGITIPDLAYYRKEPIPPTDFSLCVFVFKAVNPSSIIFGFDPEHLISAATLTSQLDPTLPLDNIIALCENYFTPDLTNLKSHWDSALDISSYACAQRVGRTSRSTSRSRTASTKKP